MISLSKSVGIIGVGNMGGAIAENLLKQAWQVWVCDVDTRKTKHLELHGAKAVKSPADLAQETKTIIICVVDALQVHSVLGTKLSGQTAGLSKVLGPHHTILLCPTIEPADVLNLSAQITSTGAQVIDAPMSGGPERAAQGKMSLMVACNRQIYERQFGLLNAIANPVFHVSEYLGDAAKTKLINNYLAGIHLLASAEAMVMAQKLGLNLQTTLSVIEASSGQSWVGLDRMHRAVGKDARSVPVKAHMTLLEKDTRLACKMGQQAGFVGELGLETAKTFKLASESGYADWDDSAMLSYLSKRAGGGE
jgi:L-threonate 2-dehydrogenase